MAAPPRPAFGPSSVPASGRAAKSKPAGPTATQHGSWQSWRSRAKAAASASAAEAVGMPKVACTLGPADPTSLEGSLDSAANCVELPARTAAHERRGSDVLPCAAPKAPASVASEASSATCPAASSSPGARMAVTSHPETQPRKELEYWRSSQKWRKDSSRPCERRSRARFSKSLAVLSECDLAYDSSARSTASSSQKESNNGESAMGSPAEEPASSEVSALDFTGFVDLHFIWNFSQAPILARLALSTLLSAATYPRMLRSETVSSSCLTNSNFVDSPTASLITVTSPLDSVVMYFP
mmetsp:Transcript_35672/g.102589  ORF Transcript_35672/g.102589 Transcript_35672/m.102589 type:complete len:298 (+) Transcript_35672:221-1114(+)